MIHDDQPQGTGLCLRGGWLLLRRWAITLAPREIETHDLLRRGFSNKEIGRVLQISENTAKFHVKAILVKLEVVDRAEAVAAALNAACCWWTDAGTCPFG